MSIIVTPVLVADLGVEGERMPVYAHVIDHPDARVLIDTGIRDVHPLTVDLDPRPRPPRDWGVDLAGIDIVVNTHLHFDHCGNNHLFPGTPIHVQRRELDDALTLDDYTIREWVETPGAQYVPVDGELELLPGVRLVPAPGHTRGSQIVVIDTDTNSGSRPTVVAGDTAVWFGELDEPRTEGQRLVVALQPEAVWLTHTREPWRPHP
ncbi:MAG: MBL fold metallo-hydrolase [Nakamurella sp.]